MGQDGSIPGVLLHPDVLSQAWVRGFDWAAVPSALGPIHGRLILLNPVIRSKTRAEIESRPCRLFAPISRVSRRCCAGFYFPLPG